MFVEGHMSGGLWEVFSDPGLYEPYINRTKQVLIAGRPGAQSSGTESPLAEIPQTS